MFVQQEDGSRTPSAALARKGSASRCHCNLQRFAEPLVQVPTVLWPPDVPAGQILAQAEPQPWRGLSDGSLGSEQSRRPGDLECSAALISMALERSSGLPSAGRGDCQAVPHCAGTTRTGKPMPFPPSAPSPTPILPRQSARVYGSCTHYWPARLDVSPPPPILCSGPAQTAITFMRLCLLPLNGTISPLASRDQRSHRMGARSIKTRDRSTRGSQQVLGKRSNGHGG